MSDFFSDFLDRAERMLLDMPTPPKKGYQPVNYTVFYSSPPEETQEEEEPDREGVSAEGWDSVSTQGWSGVSTEGLDTAVAWDNAGTYQPLARETAKREAAKKEKEAKKPEPSSATPEKRLVFSRNDIANGIIMAEVLGKPLALRHGRR